MVRAECMKLNVPGRLMTWTSAAVKVMTAMQKRRDAWLSMMPAHLHPQSSCAAIASPHFPRLSASVW